MLDAASAGLLLERCRGRQRKAVEPQDQRRDGRHQEGIAQTACRDRFARIPGEHKTDHHAGDDPTNGAPHPDARELQRRVAHLPERHGVDQGQRRHVDHHVRQHVRVEHAEIRRRIQLIQQHRTEQVQHRQDPFGIEETVGDQANDKRRNDRPPRLRGKRHADLPAAGAQRAGKKSPQGDEPATPDKELQEHHHAEACIHRGHDSHRFIVVLVKKEKTHRFCCKGIYLHCGSKACPRWPRRGLTVEPRFRSSRASLAPTMGFLAIGFWPQVFGLSRLPQQA
ncbi:hypothetical protein D3C76_1147060 [compost metagenome]